MENIYQYYENLAAYTFQAKSLELVAMGDRRKDIVPCTLSPIDTTAPLKRAYGYINYFPFLLSLFKIYGHFGPAWKENAQKKFKAKIFY